MKVSTEDGGLVVDHHRFAGLLNDARGTASMHSRWGNSKQMHWAPAVRLSSPWVECGGTFES